MKWAVGLTRQGEVLVRQCAQVAKVDSMLSYT